MEIEHDFHGADERVRMLDVGHEWDKSYGEFFREFLGQIELALHSHRTWKRDSEALVAQLEGERDTANSEADLVIGRKKEIAKEHADDFDALEAERDEFEARVVELEGEIAKLDGWPPITLEEQSALRLVALRYAEEGMQKTGEALLRLLRRPPEPGHSGESD